MFSSQIWTKRSNPAPFTLETGDSEVAVAWTARILVRVGSMSEAVGRVAVRCRVEDDAAAATVVEDDEAAKTASMANAKARTDCILTV